MRKAPYNKFVFSTKQTVGYRFPTHSAELVMDRSEAEASEAFLVILEPGEAPPLHVHYDTEQVFYVLEGSGQLEVGRGAPSGRSAGIGGSPQFFPLGRGDLIRIPPGTTHRVMCEAEKRLVYLSVDCFLAGRPAEEPTWESHLRTVCAEQGWDFNRIRRPKI